MYRLLIADDEIIERKVLYKTLQKNLGEQCVIFQAKNGREALRIYEREKIQIVILDIEMPGINGIETAMKIRESDKNCCIIFLTAFDEFSYAKKAILVRALDYLLKPCDEQELMLVLEEAMRLTGEWQKEEKKNFGRRQERRPERSREADLPSDYTEWLEDLEKTGGSRLPRVAEMILEYIEKNYVEDISMQDVAREMNYSEAYFSKLFKQFLARILLLIWQNIGSMRQKNGLSRRRSM